MAKKAYLEGLGIEDLRQRASDANVEGRSGMNKEDLVNALADDGDTTATADAGDDRPREAQQNVNPDGTRKPTRNEMESAAAAFKADMLAAGASEDDLNDVLTSTKAWAPSETFEISGGNQGHLTPYTTPSSFAVAGVPKGMDPDKGEDQGDTRGGTSKEAVS